MIESSKLHLVVFTGAGISAESGLATYRDENGLWMDANLQKLMSVGGYYETPQRVLDVLNAMRNDCFNAKPNTAHIKIATLEEMFDVTVITQNVDDLHERAGSSRVLHLHGVLTQITSSDNRGDKKYIKAYPMNLPINIGDRAADGSQMRPNVVLFGEYLTNYTDAVEIVKSADVFVIVGTSLKVFPASQIIKYVRSEIPCFIINPDETVTTGFDDYVVINEKATKGIEILSIKLKQIVDREKSLPKSFVECLEKYS